MARRDAATAEGQRGYLGTAPDGSIPDPVLRWQEAVHTPGVYDVEVDTSVATPAECATTIRRRIEEGPPTAFDHLLSNL